jgi:hypothetical protein
MKYLLTLLVILSLASKTNAQIKLPKEYSFVPGDVLSGCFFSDGRYNFFEHPYAHDGLSQQDVLTKTGYTFYKIKDDIYWTTGKNGDWYYYIVLVGTESLQLSSLYNDEQFNALSKWMLKQTLESVKNKKDLFFTDYQGGTILSWWSDMLGIKVDEGKK